MHYNEIKNEVYFYRSPKYIEGQTVNDIIDALNEMMKILLYETKEGDNLVHFVDPKAKFDKRYHKEEKLFKSSRDFFRYYNLSQYENILNKIIPEEYFTTIDNLNSK